MIFMDTSAWIALEDKKDANHIQALQFKDELFTARTRLITTNYVMDETYTLMLMDLGYTKTLDFKHKLDQLIHNNLIILFHVTPDVEQKAWKVFEQYNHDKSWSFTDCTSKVIMDKLGLFEVFTFDRHFEQMKYIKKP